MSQSVQTWGNGSHEPDKARIARLEAQVKALEDRLIRLEAKTRVRDAGEVYPYGWDVT